MFLYYRSRTLKVGDSFVVAARPIEPFARQVSQMDCLDDWSPC
jgi:hypothetical protein